jgi:hypothetical protein
LISLMNLVLELKEIKIKNPAFAGFCVFYI